MSETSRNLLVGSFVFMSFIVLSVMMAWFGEAPEWLGGNEWSLRIVGVEKLSGVAPGSPVLLNGVEIGRVKALEFVDRVRPDQGVVIVTRIKQRYTVPEGAMADVYGATLGFGSGSIEIITPGESLGHLVPDNAEIPGRMRSIIGELISKSMVESVDRTISNFGDFAQAATPVARNLAILMESRPISAVDGPDGELQPNLATVIERIDRLAANLNVVLGDAKVQEDVKAVVTDLRMATTDLKATVQLWRTASERITGDLITGIDHTNRNLDTTFTKLIAILDTLDDASKDLASVTHEISAGTGTAGLLVHDDRLYEAAVLSLERFADAMSSAQAILGKFQRDGYITLGKAPTGFPRIEIPIPSETADTSR